YTERRSITFFVQEDKRRDVPTIDLYMALLRVIAIRGQTRLALMCLAHSSPEHIVFLRTQRKQRACGSNRHIGQLHSSQQPAQSIHQTCRSSSSKSCLRRCLAGQRRQHVLIPQHASSPLLVQDCRESTMWM